MRLNLNSLLSSREAVLIPLMPLELLGPGEWGEVQAVTGEPSWIGRLAELGIRSGSHVQVVQPGSPCLLNVGGCRLSLRGECACQVFVRPMAE